MQDRENRPEHRHVPPYPGEPQPLSTTFSPARGVRTAGFTTVANRLFAPLPGLDPNNVLQGGYGWLSLTDGGQTLHPGFDLNLQGGCNADEGALVVTPLAGQVRRVLHWDGITPGEGNHIWIELTDPCAPYQTWIHYDHLAFIEANEGQSLPPGGVVGLCGRSGGWDCAHLHAEWSRGGPGSWWQWPYQWSRSQVEAAYWNPTEWWYAATALIQLEAGDTGGVAMLEDWQVLNWIMPTLWQDQGFAYNPDSGVAKAWLARFRAGHYPGSPVTNEVPYGEGDEAGVWQQFAYGIVTYRTRDGGVSWVG